MACSECGAPTISLAVPDAYREHLLDEPSVVACCTSCLRLESRPADATAPADPAVDRISDAVPSRPDRAIPLLIAVGLLDSLATNRGAIEALLRHVERAGADPLLAIDRLIDDPDVDPAVDLERRRHQVEQLLY